MPAFVRWSAVRAFGNVKYFNISYVVLFGMPIAHELYVKGAPLMKWFGAPAPFPTTFRWAYGASLTFAIAIAVYQWRCPEIIKRFGSNKDEYLKAEYESYQRALPSHRLNVVIANLDPELDRGSMEEINTLLNQKAEVGNDGAAIQEELDKVIARLHPDAVQRFLLKSYDRLNESDRFFRLTSAFFYLTGSIILFVLLLWKSYGVLLM
jgi:uncharacterized membrane protein